MSEEKEEEGREGKGREGKGREGGRGTSRVLRPTEIILA